MVDVIENQAGIDGNNGDNKRLFGTGANETIRGREGDDVLRGYGGNDRLFGGPDRDVLFGGPGQDNLDGGPGADKMYGGDENDVLFALGDPPGRPPGLGEEIFEDISSMLGEEIVDPINAPDLLSGDDGRDLFYIRESAEGEGFGFFAGQRYAIIRDFQPEDDAQGDLIRLPGGPQNYRTELYDRDADGSNDSTAIIYTEDPNIDPSISVPVLGGISTSNTIELAKEDALVALVPGQTVGNLTDSDFYIYGSSTTPLS